MREKKKKSATIISAVDASQILSSLSDLFQLEREIYYLLQVKYKSVYFLEGFYSATDEMCITPCLFALPKIRKRSTI